MTKAKSGSAEVETTPFKGKLENFLQKDAVVVSYKKNEKGTGYSTKFANAEHHRSYQLSAENVEKYVKKFNPEGDENVDR